MERIDIAIIGCGPAGLSAAINGKIRNKSLRVFGVKLCSPALHKAHCIDNYLGLPGLSGEDLRQRFLRHAEEMGIVPTTEGVTAIYPMGDYFELQLRSQSIQASALILTTGVSVAKPLPGEERLTGRGISYCATCDGNLYRGKRVAVIADNAEGEEEVNFLADLTDMVYYLPRYQGPYSLKENVQIVVDKVVEFYGTNKLEHLVLKSGEKLAVDGCFVHKEQLPLARIVPGLELDEGNHVKVDRAMATNIHGLFAAGDVTGRPYQLAKAVGEGQVAALSAVKHLDSRRS